jgi:hypothetical protein
MDKQKLFWHDVAPVLHLYRLADEKFEEFPAGY